MSDATLQAARPSFGATEEYAPSGLQRPGKSMPSSSGDRATPTASQAPHASKPLAPFRIQLDSKRARSSTGQPISRGGVADFVQA
jgi:hypothetical protein